MNIPYNQTHQQLRIVCYTKVTQKKQLLISVTALKICNPGLWYKKAGVMLMDICKQDVIQGNIFDTIDRKKHSKLMEILDRTNDRYGRNTLKLAVQGDGKQWKIKQEKLSPAYTTRIKDFPKVK